MYSINSAIKEGTKKQSSYPSITAAVTLSPALGGRYCLSVCLLPWEAATVCLSVCLSVCCPGRPLLSAVCLLPWEAATVSKQHLPPPASCVLPPPSELLLLSVVATEFRVADSTALIFSKSSNLASRGLLRSYTR